MYCPCRYEWTQKNTWSRLSADSLRLNQHDFGQVSNWVNWLWRKSVRFMPHTRAVFFSRRFMRENDICQDGASWYLDWFSGNIAGNLFFSTKMFLQIVPSTNASTSLLPWHLCNTWVLWDLDGPCKSQYMANRRYKSGVLFTCLGCITGAPWLAKLVQITPITRVVKVLRYTKYIYIYIYRFIYCYLWSIYTVNHLITRGAPPYMAQKRRLKLLSRPHPRLIRGNLARGDALEYRRIHHHPQWMKVGISME